MVFSVKLQFGKTLVSVQNKFALQKDFLFRKFWTKNKYKFQKKFWVQKFKSMKKMFFVQKKYLVRKKKFWSKKIVGPKKSLDENHSLTKLEFDTEDQVLFIVKLNS